ncbi:hypothetical protein HI292_33815 [Corallococcus exiguus]|nr:hypothetical protein [Corallococcus exiguus]
MGVFLSYVPPRRHALVERELCLPEAWVEDSARPAAEGIPEEVGFESKPALAQGVLQRTLAAGLKPEWVVGEEIYGRDTTLRRFSEDLHQPYMLTVAANTHVWIGIQQVQRILTSAWVRLSTGRARKARASTTGHAFASTITWACRGGCCFTGA